jgi:tetratricopeptide (TPR) repeat protein/serine/threonine protein kinase
MTERDLFLAARPLSAVARAAYLEAACGEDATLRGQVEALLHEHDELGSFLESPILGLAETVVEPVVAEQPGAMIGRYRLLERLGEGGFGIVFRAEQQQPVHRQVALKVLKPGMDTRQIIGRFEAERQALALMDHPHIARVLDGGETASGRPYVVMELVHGIPITDYCDQQRLAPRDRLELFVTVCQAVQHAHQKGIIHRDLKPSNVLVTADSGVPVAKVIDFGIAKAVGQRLTDITVSTGFAQLVGTPLYMSPEQAELRSLDIDTRSDIYSLGVLLYELLTGTTPFDKERLQRVGYDEMRRIICEEEPPTPSTRVSGLGEAATVIATQRRSEPKQLRQLCRGELDWIVMKALEKDRSRRYETASALAADVQHYLRDEPVTASPPSAWYRIRKFAWRNRLVLVAAGAVLLTVALSAGSLGWAIRDRSLRHEEVVREAAKALEDVDRLRQEGHWVVALAVAQRTEALLAGGGDTTIHRQFRELCRDLEMAARLEEVRLHKTEVKNEAFDTTRADREYADVFREFGINVGQGEPTDVAEQIRCRSISEELGAALDDWASLQSKMGKPAASRLWSIARAADPDPFRNNFRTALESGQRKRLEELAASEEVARLPPSTIVLLAQALDAVRAEASAIALLRQAQMQHPDDFWINSNLATFLAHAHSTEVGEAVRFASQAVGLRPQSPGAAVNLGVALNAQGKLPEALESYRRAINLQPRYAAAHFDAGFVLYHQRKLTSAAECFRRAIEVKPDSVEAHFYLGLVLADQGRLVDSLDELRRSIQIKPNNPDAYYNLCLVLAQLGKHAEAADACRRAIEFNPGWAEAHCNLGNNLSNQGKLVEAAQEFRRAIELKPDLFYAHYNFAKLLRSQGKLVDALQEYQKSAQCKPDHADSYFWLGMICAQLGQWTEATAMLQRFTGLQPDDHLGWYWIAMIRLHAHDAEGYRQACREMLARFANTHDPGVADNTARILTLAPEAVASTDAILRLADQSAKSTNERGPYAWVPLLTKALAEYRAGDYAGTVEWLKRFSPNIHGEGPDATAYALLAMAHHRLGRVRESHAALAHAQTILAKKMPNPAQGRPFGDDCDAWLHSEIIWREAEEVLNAQDLREGAVKPPVTAPGR